MKILYVVSRALEINTSASIRNHATIMGLIENGHHITLLSATPDENHAAYDESLTVEQAEKKYVDLGGMQAVAKIGRKSKILTQLKPIVYRMLYGSEIYDNLKGIVNHIDEVDVSKYDLVISSSDPKSSHLFVDKLFEKNGKNIPWVQIWGDPFADDITRKNGGTKKVAQEEERLLSHADKVVYVSKLTCESQKKKYEKCAKKMVYIPIPYYKERRSNMEFPTDYRDVKLCYCGDYGTHIRNLQPLYAAAKEIGVRMTICGMSDLKLESTERITVLPRQGADTVRKNEQGADVLVHLSNLSGTQIPGKIYQYVSTDKTILFLLDGEINVLRETFEKYNRFIFVENRKEEIVSVLQKICELRKAVSNEPVAEFSAKYIANMIIGTEIS